jgi:hypothetical protein
MFGTVPVRAHFEEKCAGTHNALEHTCLLADSGRLSRSQETLFQFLNRTM